MDPEVCLQRLWLRRISGVSGSSQPTVGGVEAGARVLTSQIYAETKPTVHRFDTKPTLRGRDRRANPMFTDLIPNPLLMG